MPPSGAESGPIRCRQCGKVIWQRDRWPLEPPHCATGSSVNGQLFSSGEQLPDWATEAVEASGWLSGKLLCGCGSTLGSFDFVSGRKCPCGETVLLPVHLNLKKIDVSLPDVDARLRDEQYKPSSISISTEKTL